LLEYQLGSPSARLLECDGVFIVEQTPQVGQSGGGRRRNHAVRIRPELLHEKKIRPVVYGAAINRKDE
jgi:hypothetical protein